jgi:predicted MFS family arabinose efflux permease
MTKTSASWSTLFRGSHLVHTVLLTLGVGVHAIGIHLIATVLPSVVVDIGGAAFYAWATMLYTMASIIGTACGGLAKAALGLRRGYLAGVLIVLAGWAGCAVAPHVSVLLIARAIQGFGSGLLVALAYGMVSEFYTEALRPRVLSAISGIWGIAALVGPMVGGLFATSGWWRGAFWVVIPILLLLGGLAWRALPAAEAHEAAGEFPSLRLTLLGAGVLCVAVSGHVAPLPWRLLLLASAVVLVGCSFRLDGQAAKRLFPTQPMSLRTPVGTAYWMFFLFGNTTSLVTVFMPLFLYVLHGISPLGAGYVSALLSISWTVLALCSAGLRDRQVRQAIVLGPLLMLCGVVGLRTYMTDGPILILSLFVALTGAGIGLCFAHISSWTMAAARAGEGTLTAASIPTVQSLGIAFGAAVGGMVANTAGLAQGVSPVTVTSAATWVLQLGIVPPAAMVVLSGRLLWLHRERKPCDHDNSAAV